MNTTPITHGLKEWAIVCDLLAAGRMALLPRKGGIREWGGPGVFELEHHRFWLFPTREHEKPDRIKPAFLTAAGAGPEDPACVRLPAYAEAARLWRVPSRAAFDRLDDLHPWLPPAIDMRFDYKPENPLYLVALRVYRPEVAPVVPLRAAYRGCRSWVPFEAADVPPAAGAAAPVLADEVFGALLDRVSATLHGA